MTGQFATLDRSPGHSMGFDSRQSIQKQPKLNLALSSFTQFYRWLRLIISKLKKE
jgi:hypothetical protein